MRFLTVLALAGLLAACSLGATTPSENVLPTVSGSDDMASADPAMACVDAFAAVDADAIAAMGTLDALTDELDATISACGTVEDWTTTAETVLPTIDTTAVETFLSSRCDGSATLAEAEICAEIGS